jgi:aspartokinase
MRSIGKIAEDLINRSPFLREAITEELINISALARKLKPEIEHACGKEVQEGAIIMAIKRLNPSLYRKVNLKITNVMGDIGDFSIRKKLVDFTFENSPSLNDKHHQLVTEINQNNDAFYTWSKGVSETTIILNASHKSLVERIFKEENLRAHNKDLAAVTVTLPFINSEIHGVYYYILKHIAWDGINIIEIVSTSNEFTLVIKQEDVDNVLSILTQVKRSL